MKKTQKKLKKQSKLPLRLGSRADEIPAGDARGRFIGWKKVDVRDETGLWRRTAVLKLEIRGDVLFSSCDDDYYPNLHNKIRTNELKVLSGPRLRTGEEFCSGRVRDFRYEVGKIYRVRLSRKERACASGLHFFLKRKQAAEYAL